jgi:pimeloyl-ACP methyl ester carboxylesterase
MDLLFLLLIPALLIIAAWYLFPTLTGRALLAAERYRNGVSSHNLIVAEQDWHYLEAGRGTPMLALHGIAADADHWTRLAGYLRRDFQVIAPDLPGFGDSSPPLHGDYTLDAQVIGLEKFVAALGLDTFVLLGNSMGGQLAAAFAARHPDRVTSLCLLAPSGVLGARFSPVLKAVVTDQNNPLVVRNKTDFNNLLNWCFYRLPWIPGPLRKILLDRTIQLEDNTRAAFDDMRFFSNSLESIAPLLKMSCLIVWGKQDQVLDVSGAEILAAAIDSAELVIFDQTGHLPMLEKPAQCAGIIKRFVDGLPVADNNT